MRTRGLQERCLCGEPQPCPRRCWNIRTTVPSMASEGTGTSMALPAVRRGSVIGWSRPEHASRLRTTKSSLPCATVLGDSRSRSAAPVSDLRTPRVARVQTVF